MKRSKFKLDLVLDSGAFSASTKNEKIDIDEYAAYIKKYEKYLTLYVNLDVIGDAKATMKNQEYLESLGLHPMPVYHIGEEISYLKQLMNKYEYIGIGGIANISGAGHSFKFLNQVFDVVCDDKGFPRNKLHAFGITNTESMMLYPWYSVDSTSWLYSSRMGLLYVPRKLASGEWDLLETTGKYFKPSITNTSPFLGMKDKHIYTCNKAVQQLYHDWLDCHNWKEGKSEFHHEPEIYKLKQGERWLSARAAKTIDRKATAKSIVESIIEVGLCNDYTSRDIANATYFREMAACLPTYPWAWKRPKMRGFV